jgi:hypothetical protein
MVIFGVLLFALTIVALLLWAPKINSFLLRRKRKREVFKEGRRAFNANDRYNPYQSPGLRAKWEKGYNREQRAFSKRGTSGVKSTR